MTEKLEIPKVTCKYTGPESGELALFWINPWSKQEEKIATFWWPGHPFEATEQVEQWFERIGHKATQERDSLPGSEELLRSRLGPSPAEQLAALDAPPIVIERGTTRVLRATNTPPDETL